METLQKLEKRLQELEEEIKEAEDRLPAHSTKPQTMMMLLELEDERDELMLKIKTLKADTSNEA